jgi:prolipoprotein diacylglyceryltransferase
MILNSLRNFFHAACRQEHAFKLCGVAGLLLGAPLAIWLALHLGHSPRIEMVLISVAVGMLLLTPLTVKVFTGVDGFVFYRDVICIFAAIWLALRWLHQPMLPYLDATITGAGVFHACGRIGCLLSGCCFGRPSKFGRCYGHAHVSMGFPLELTGVRLFPIQAVESIWIGILVAFSTIQLLHHAIPGTVFASYVTGYALGRFVFEFARGDADRPYTLGFSQAQWISLILMSAMLWGELRGALPFHLWHAFALGALIFTMLLVAVMRRLANAPRHLLLTPGHMQEIAAALKQAFDHAGAVSQGTPVFSTSLGIQISGGILTRCGDPIFHYALSSQDSHLPPAAARVLVRFILRLRHPLVRFYQCSQSSLGVYHLLVPQDKPR